MIIIIMLVVIGMQSQVSKVIVVVIVVKENNIHIVNAVSPAFTSCFSLAEFIVDKIS